MVLSNRSQCWPYLCNWYEKCSVHFCQYESNSLKIQYTHKFRGSHREVCRDFSTNRYPFENLTICIISDEQQSGMALFWWRSLVGKAPTHISSRCAPKQITRDRLEANTWGNLMTELRTPDQHCISHRR